MMTTAGVGFSDAHDSYTAGREAAEAAMVASGADHCDLAMLFATYRHDPAALIAGARSVIGSGARLIGGSAGGIITSDRLGYDGYQVGIALLGSDSIQIDLFTGSGLNHGEFATGAALGRQIAATSFTGEPNLIVMYDSTRKVAENGPPVLNMATPLIRGIESTLSPLPPMAGAGLFGDAQFCLPLVQWCDDTIVDQSALVLALSGNVRMDTLILHGCRPSSGYHTVTKSEGPVIHQIDGRPALDVVEELVGPESGLTIADFPLFITLGINRGDKFGEFREEDYVNRLCFSVDPQQRTLILFEPDLEPGAEIQLMRRSIGFEYITRRVESFFAGLDDRRPILAFYIDCMGRAGAYSSTDQEEGEEVQRAIGSRVPLLGMYSGVEIASIAGSVQALDWTGVLCLFSE